MCRSACRFSVPHTHRPVVDGVLGRGAWAGKPGYDLFAPGLFDDDAEDRQAGDERYRRELGAHIYACTGIWPR